MPAPATLPQQIGRYRILSTLGVGGMGAVYLAQDSTEGRKVALKVPLQTAADNPLLAARFLREARAAAAVRHSYLCPILEQGEADGFQYLVMPFIEGKPLSKLIDDEHPWKPSQALALVKKLASGLQVLHERGLIHRDLKPGNVMIRANGEPVIMDFGLVKSVENQSKQLTQVGALVGTPSYMAPEQVLGNLDALGPATDIYALAVILYELLTGEVPFVGPMQVVFGQILHSPPAAPSSRRAEIPARLDAVCLKALAKEPEDRYPSMSAFAAALTLNKTVAPTAPFPDAKMKETASDIKEPFTIDGAIPVDDGAIPVEPPSVGRVTCTKCKKNLKIPPEAEGRKLFCPRCQSDLTEALRQKRDKDLPVRGNSDGEEMKSPWVIWLTLCVVLVVGTLASFLYLRQSANHAAESDFDLVPRNASVVMTLRPADLLKTAVGSKLIAAGRENKELDLGDIEKKIGLKLEEVERMTLVMSDVSSNAEAIWLIVTTLKPYDRQKVLAVTEAGAETSYNGKKYHAVPMTKGAIHFVNEKRFVTGSERGVKRCLELPSTPAKGPQDETVRRAMTGNPSFVLGLAPTPVMRQSVADGKGLGALSIKALLSANALVWTARVGERVELEFHTELLDAAKATEANQELKDIILAAKQRLANTPFAKSDRETRSLVDELDLALSTLTPRLEGNRLSLRLDLLGNLVLKGMDLIRTTKL